MTTYRVDVSRDGACWLLQVYLPGLQRWTQARRLGEVRETTRDLIALTTGDEIDSIELDLRVTLPADVQAHLDRSRELRAQAAQAQRLAAQELRTAAQALQNCGMSLKEIGEVLGVSYQRAHQLVNDERRAA